MKPQSINELPAFKVWLHRFAIALILHVVVHSSTRSQVIDETAGNPSTPLNSNDDQTKLVESQIELLGATSYRERLSARTLIEQRPAVALEVITRLIDQVETTIAVQLVDILSGLAMHSDKAISSQATELLGALANEATTVGRGSTNSLRAIADLREENAIKVLEECGAIIGYQEFSINGKQIIGGSRRIALTINDEFAGTDQELDWIRYLKSIEVVYLHGPKATPVAIEAASQLKQLKGLKLRDINLTADLLLKFHDLKSLEQLGISYVDIDDSFVPILMQLPISESIRLLGTKITESGKQQLETRFVGVEIYRGKGGFLGISSEANSCRVKEVTPNSAAHRGGVLTGDRILSIHSRKVSVFEELRAELAKFDVGESVEIEVERIDRRNGLFQPRQLTLIITLQQEP